MDALAFRLANRLLGNSEDCAALELTVTGPTLKFACDTRIALTGANMRLELDGRRVEAWRSVDIAAGSVLKVGSIDGAGQRAYLAVHGGFDVPPYMDSRATFTLGQFGGHAGRALRNGDVLRIGGATHAGQEPLPAVLLPTALRPAYAGRWEIAVLYGPHGAPDFFTAADIETLLRHRLAGPLQLESHRRAADRSEAGLGAH